MSKDLRDYSRQTQLRLIIGFFILLFILGDGLILFFYGSSAAVLGLICILVALIPLFFIWIFFGVIDRIVRHAEDENDSE